MLGRVGDVLVHPSYGDTWQVLDGEAMFEYVTQQLGCPEVPCTLHVVRALIRCLDASQEQVVLHGRSIGGAVSLAVAGNHPKVNVCNERSFSSLYAVIFVLFRAILGVDHFKPSPSDTWKVTAKQKLKVALVYLVAGLARCIGWDYPSAQNWNRVTGFKWAFYHPHDQIIPMEASLYSAVQHTTEPFYRWRMEGNPADGHNRALTEEEEHWNLSMMVQAIQTSRRRSHDEASGGAARRPSADGEAEANPAAELDV